MDQMMEMMEAAFGPMVAAELTKALAPILYRLDTMEAVIATMHADAKRVADAIQSVKDKGGMLAKMLGA